MNLQNRFVLALVGLFGAMMAGASLAPVHAQAQTGQQQQPGMTPQDTTVQQQDQWGDDDQFAEGDQQDDGVRALW